MLEGMNFPSPLRVSLGESGYSWRMTRQRANESCSNLGMGHEGTVMIVIPLECLFHAGCGGACASPVSGQPSSVRLGLLMCGIVVITHGKSSHMRAAKRFPCVSRGVFGGDTGWRQCTVKQGACLMPRLWQGQRAQRSTWPQTARTRGRRRFVLLRDVGFHVCVVCWVFNQVRATGYTNEGILPNVLLAFSSDTSFDDAMRSFRPAAVARKMP